MAEHKTIVKQEVMVEEVRYTYSPREQWTHHICAAVALLGTVWLSYHAFAVNDMVHDGRYVDLIVPSLPVLAMVAFLNQCYPKPEELTK